MSDEFYVYMIECNDGSYYTGQTSNVKRRFHRHQNKNAARYTSVDYRHPLRLVYVDTVPTRSDAMSRERLIKTKSHDQKKALTASGVDRVALVEEFL